MNEQELRERLHHAVKTRLSGIEPDPWLSQRVVVNAKGETKVKKKLSFGLVLAIILVLVTTMALAASVITGHYERIGFVDSSAHDKWSIWVGDDAFLYELGRIDALVDTLAGDLYAEDIIIDATAKTAPGANATEKKALRTALYSFWDVADPDFFYLDTFTPSSYEVSIVYEDSVGTGAGTWHVRLNPAKDSGLPYYYAEVSAMNNQLIRIHKLNEDGTKTLKIIYFGAIEWDYDEFIAMGEHG